ncbi:MAG: HAD family hydrolase [Rhodobiaceae bacterium]|nr:MAG: HAD family hydrolase [Rhodobiaceae bacterium]
MIKPDLVIFDCDGVLVDTEHAANLLLSQLIRDEGLDLSYEECRRRFVGKAMQTVQAEVSALLGRQLPSDWYLMVKQRSIEVLAEGTEAIAGVEAQILAIQEAKVPFCVASSGQIEKMHATLGSAKLLPLLKDLLFSADMVAHGKPAPDLFLHAAREMGHAPEVCVVIEDSLPGVQAGVAAGMKVFGYAGDPMTDRKALAAAGAQVFDDMRDLSGLIGL